MAETTPVFRTARLRAFRSVLRPAGFVRGKHLFVRHAVGGPVHQIHGVQFQASQFARHYYVNVAFHYDFLPARLATLRGEASPVPERLHLLDFMLETRLEDRMPPDYPPQWRYGRDDVEPVAAQMERNARDAVAALDALADRWRDPAVMLKLLPPNLLEEDHRQSLARAELRPEELVKLPPLPYEAALGEGWTAPDSFYHPYCMALIARRAGRTALARRYLAVAEALGEGKGADLLKALRRRLGRLRRKGRPSS